MSITEEILHQRIGKITAGNLLPQIYITIAVCMGQTIFGALFGWGSPADKHIFEMDAEDYDAQYAFTVSLGPLATSLGMFPCWFFAKRIGPKRTILIQTPFNILCWILATFIPGIKFYHIFRFFTAFFSTTYYYCGEVLMIETVHRKYQKIMYSCCRISFFLGILLMNIIGPITKRTDLYICGGAAVMITALALILPPESPVYWMRYNTEKAKKSLRWYRQQNDVTRELEIIANYVSFQKYETSGFVPMIKTKVVSKALKVCGILFILKGISGYYAFMLNSPRWFASPYCCVTPYFDSIIYSFFVVVLRFASVLVHLYGPFGIKKPLLVSTFATSVLLIIFGYYKFILERVEVNETSCVALPTMCFYACAYECGLSLCPEITLYNYVPFQIYVLVTKIMQMLQWLVIFVVIGIYLVTITKWQSYVTLWILALNMFIGYILVMICVVEVKGKSLMKIQIALGGNPVGTRGSRRQTIATPMDKVNTNIEIQELIKKYSTENRATDEDDDSED